MDKIKKRDFGILDIYLAAFLSIHGIKPELKIANNRVTFNFPVTDELYRIMYAYNSNEPTPVADFVTSIKTLRGQMLTMRGPR